MKGLSFDIAGLVGNKIKKNAQTNGLSEQLPAELINGGLSFQAI